MRFFPLAVAALNLSFAVRAVQSQATPALDAVARAMGGKDRVLAIRTLAMEAVGEALWFGQTITPYSKTNLTVTSLRRSYDFADRRWQFDLTYESRFLTPVPPATRVRTGLDGDVSYTIVGNGAIGRNSTATAVERSAEFIYHPTGFVQAAFAPGSRVSETQSGGERRIHLTADGKSFEMRIDRRTHLPTQISRVVEHPMLGDVALRVLFSDWTAIGGVRLPMRIVQRQADWVLSDYRITSARVNDAIGNLAVNDSIRAKPAPQSPSTFNVVAEELAPGVWILDSGLYHTIAIEQSNRIVLVEAPEGDARTLSAIAKARELRPGKPVGPIVNTHHHFDHAGGVRAAVSEGLAIITHEANTDFYERLVYPAHHALHADALDRHPQPLRLTPVRDTLMLRDSMRPIEVYEAKGAPHSGSILVVYLPHERILIQADLETEDLEKLVESRGLRVERLVGLHDRPVSWPVR